MKQVKQLITPFKTLENKMIWNILLICVLIFLWGMSGSEFIPTPREIVGSLPRLMEKDIVRNFIHSLTFCFKSIFIASFIALFFCYLSVIPVFSTFCEFLRKFRFLPSAGLSFLFLKVAGGEVVGQMTYMMIFGIVTWLIDGMIGIALSITKDDILYAKSLRMNNWRIMYEVLIKGKASELFSCIISNFAMAWMMLATIENIAKASGGIGVILSESNKYYKFEEVYAIQLMILITGIFVDSILRTLQIWIFPHSKVKRI